MQDVEMVKFKINFMKQAINILLIMIFPRQLLKKWKESENRKAMNLWNIN